MLFCSNKKLKITHIHTGHVELLVQAQLNIPALWAIMLTTFSRPRSSLITVFLVNTFLPYPPLPLSPSLPLSLSPSLPLSLSLSFSARSLRSSRAGWTNWRGNSPPLTRRKAPLWLGCRPSLNWYVDSQTLPANLSHNHTAYLILHTTLGIYLSRSIIIQTLPATLSHDHHTTYSICS